jgi:dihydropteroate synthase
LLNSNKRSISMPTKVNPEHLQAIDDELSKRPIALDPGGYYVIYLDQEAGLICAKHYTNIINEQGLAVDPATGEVIACGGKKVERTVEKLYTARTAKELCVKIVEEPQPCPITMLDHAAYLGREFTRAEYALVNGIEYIQD